MTDKRASRWEADQRLGFFGYHARKPPHAAQPMHFQCVDIAEALSEVDEEMMLWGNARAFPAVPAFSGGVLDSWPARLVTCFQVCDAESASVDAFLRGEAAPTRGDRG